MVLDKNADIFEVEFADTNNETIDVTEATCQQLNKLV